MGKGRTLLLRRISKHVKDQNWFAVVLDFFIVVIGVFIGIQVANWNTARANKADDLNYMQRLHDEIVTGESANLSISKELAITVSLLSDLVKKVSSVNADLPLSRDECDAIFASHIYRPGRVSIPTMEELIASGRASIISDAKLRRSILLLSQLRRATDEFNGRISNDAVELHRKYPGVISLNSELTYDRFGFAPYGGHTCYPELFQEYPGFRNDLVDNLYRMDSYTLMAHKPEVAVLAEIHASLDRILSITHEPDT